jgi:hypothetical protein
MVVRYKLLPLCWNYFRELSIFTRLARDWQCITSCYLEAELFQEIFIFYNLLPCWNCLDPEEVLHN